MSKLKEIKLAVLRLLKLSGGFRIVANSRWRKNRLLIVAYHGVSLCNEHEWQPGLYMHQDRLRSRLQKLRDNRCNVLPLDEALRRLYDGELPDRSVALTFDDGNYDFYKQAYPLLDEFNFPVTVYLTSYYSGFNRPVFDVMASYLLWLGRKGIFDSKKVIGRGDKIDLSRTGSHANVLNSIRSFARDQGFSACDKDSLLIATANQLGIDYDTLLAKRILHLLTPQEVQQLSSNGVDIQLHTHRHRMPHDRSLFMREIEDNRDQIQSVTGRTALHFCYPSGVYDPVFFPWLEEMNVRSATTCVPGIASRQTHPLLIPRLIDSSTLFDVEFEGWLAGCSALLPRRRQMSIEM